MIADLRGLVVLSSFIHMVYCQGVSTITVSTNPVYSGEPVTLTCTLNADGATLLSVSIETFNETRREGTLLCDPSGGNTFQNAGEGRFAGYRYTGCERLSVKNPSVSLIASPSWGLDYKCRFEAFFKTTGTIQNVTSASTRLSVRVLPEVPSLHPSLLVFNETDNVVLGCSSAHGTPAATINFIVVQRNGQNSQEGHGVASVTLRLTGPAKDWHNADVTCSVQNHHFENMTARGVIRVNHIAAIGDSSPTVSAYASSQPLDCSVHVMSFPGATYRWSVPDNVNISESASISPVLTVQQGTFGSFHCTATNNFTGKTQVITFDVTSEKPPIPDWIIVVAVVVSAIIIIIVVLVVLYKRGCFSKVLTRDDGSSVNCNNQNRAEGNYRQEMHDSNLPLKSRASYPDSGRGKGDDGVVKESLIRGGLPAQPTDDTECPEYSRLKPQLSAAGNRLLIAADGVVANLKHKTLPTTVLISYPDNACTLEGILVQVGQAIPLPAPPSFRSVALLLRRHKVGLSLSEIDRAVLTSRSVTGERGDKLRDFLTRLASMSLNKRAGDTRIDVLNYGGTDAAQLAKALEDLLKVSVTVSSDLFGMDVTNSLRAANRSAVGEDYFNRRNLNEVVYADVGVPDGPMRSQPIKQGDQVLYSEIARNV